MRIARRVLVGIGAMACFTAGFAGAVAFPGEEREARAGAPAAVVAPPVARPVPDGFRAEVEGLCRREVDWAAQNAGLWRGAEGGELRRLRTSVSRLRSDGLEGVDPRTARDRRTLARLDGALREIGLLLEETGRADADSVVDQAYRSEILLELEASLRAFSDVAAERGLKECELS